MQKITPFLWFDNNAEEAMNFYTSVFKNSKVKTGSDSPSDIPSAKEGDFLVGSFELEGVEFMVLNGGPMFKFNESVSFMIHCENQQEVDYYWEKLTDGGEESMCGWLKDKFGLSWQVTPIQLPKMLGDDDPDKSKRVFEAMMQMQKIDIATLEKAYAG